MYIVYVLYSSLRDKYYVGSTNDLECRLRRHNTNHKGFTGKVGDWKVVYHEGYSEKTLCLKRELEIKKWKSRKRIESLIKLG